MLHVLIDHNPAIRKLINEGYEVEINDKFILVNHIPYITVNKTVMYGSIASTYRIYDKEIRMIDHTAYFCGDMFCNIDYTPISSIINSSQKIEVASKVFSSYFLSSKPSTGYYDNFYDKFITYIKIISGPALFLDPTVVIKTFKSIHFMEGSIFNYPNIATPIEGYDELLNKLEKMKIGIIGLGGTGSYILDYLAKTNISEIHLFDGDDYYAHNAYRAPGVTTLEELQFGYNKVEYFASKYSSLRKGIIAHPCYITEENLSLLDNLDFVFVSIDNGKYRKIIHDYLFSKNVDFIDNGIGMDISVNGVYGTARVSLLSEKHNKFDAIDYSNNRDNIYDSNLQIVEFNSLNACLAVIRFKQFIGFYLDDVDPDLTTLSISNLEVYNG